MMPKDAQRELPCRHGITKHTIEQLLKKDKDTGNVMCKAG